VTEETDDKTVIHYPWVWNLTVWLLGGIAIARIVSRGYQSAIAAVLVFLLILIPSIAEKRRKLEISSKGVAYWPPFGLPRKANFADVTLVQKIAKLVRVNSPHGVPGVELRYPNFEFLMIPLDLPNSDEVYDKIFKAWEAQRAVR